MEAHLAAFIRGTPDGAEAEAILRKCVHCGFCTATCPTYQILGDELDGPRGRIYLIKEVLEGKPVSAKTRLHLDRCLTCRACETTCPSGVRYGRLIDIGRKAVEARAPRSAAEDAQRAALAWSLPNQALFGAGLKLGQTFRDFMPGFLRDKVPPPAPAPGTRPGVRHARRVLALSGCVQATLAPQINAAAARVLDRIGISLVEVPGTGCCGALRFHLNKQAQGLADMRALIDAWWPLIARGEVSAIAMTASGCGATVREYDHYLAQDPGYRDKAQRVAGMTRDLSEIVAAEAEALAGRLPTGRRRGKAAFQSPCSLQHGQKLRGVVEGLLARAGYELTAVPDAHLCCGSAGTYSLLQPAIAGELKKRKIAALESGVPSVIATANIGCLTHLQGAGRTRVRHWIELIDEALAETK